MFRLWEQFKSSPTIIKIAITGVIAIWTIAVMAFIASLIIFWERPSQAQPSVSSTSIPAIRLEPAYGPVNTAVTIHGQGWPADSTVLIYLADSSETEFPSYAASSVVVDAEGQFVIPLIIPMDPRWEAPDVIRIIARSMAGEATTQAFFSLISILDEATETPVATVEPTATLAAPVEPTATPTLVVPATAQPANPLLTATTDLNIRSGPGTDYAVLGLLRAGQSAEVTGLSPDGSWWQIKFAGTTDERGWVSARYVTAQHTGNVPIVQPPALPPKPIATVISDWRGEYYNNANLSGNPIVVRNDAAINFDWGTSAPVAGVGADNFSVRWSRNLSFPAGTFRFYVQVDDGVRLWVGNDLVIDQWHDSAPTTYVADVTLTEGTHQLRMEYYEHTGSALAQLTWQLSETYPDWKGEYFNNPSLSGAPVLARNDLNVHFGWGPNSPGPGVPADNFSVRWTRSMYFSAGTYRFKLLVDDGARLWVDDNLIMDQWRTGDPKSYTAEVTLSDGTHRLRLEYFEFRYDAQVRLDWERLNSNYPDWKAEYYKNRKLEGSPILVRNEAKIDYNWGTGSPAAGIPADNFSVRWTRKADFPAGIYVFRIKVDDGVRFWLDDDLVIASWRDGGARVIEAERHVSAGQHRLKVEYFEHGGEARIEVKWQKKDNANRPPQPDPGGPYTVDEGRLVTFDGRESRDPDGTIVAYEWDFDYKNNNFTVDAVGPTASTRYPDGPATITIALRVTDDKRAKNLVSTKVKVNNVAPTVEAGGPYFGQVGSLITMVGTATDPGLIDQAGLSYHWEFGDGSAGSGPVVSHSYAQAKTYTAKLTVTDKDGARRADTAVVQVAKVNRPPRAVINGPTGGLVGEVLKFSSSRSSDSDGNIVNYAWDLGDGTTGNGINVSHAYSAAGSYQVTLTVTDDGDLTGQAEHTISITEVVNKPPRAVINGPTSGLVGDVLSFSGSDSSDPDGKIVDYAWDFGDGLAVSGVDVNYSYHKKGSYQVTLTVTDDGGLTGQAEHTISITEVVNKPPQAIINGPSSGLVGEKLSFSGSNSSDPDGNIVDYAWNFGNGTPPASGVDVSHSYDKKGSYQVTLTVTDDGGLTRRAKHTILIHKPAKLPPVAVISDSGSGFVVGQVIEFSGSGSSDPDGPAVINYTWDFGDGTPNITGEIVSHSYQQPGNYTVTLTVTDEGGLTNTATRLITIT